MNTIRTMLRTVTLVIAVAILSVVTAVPALAKDVIHLKDGRVLEGTISRELPSGAIYFEIEIGSLRSGEWYRPEQISKIVRGEAVAGGSEEAEEEAAIPDGATRIAFITLEEMVGPFFNKNAIEHSIEFLDELPDEEKPSIVVFQIDSGGGALIELREIVPYIHEHVKPEYRTVAWIRSAISAAAMTAWVIPEIYMMKEGNIGACTAFSTPGGKTKAMEGDGLEMLLMWMEQVSWWGQKDPYVMRAMQVYTTLSATQNADGSITWYLDDSGDTIVSPKKEILTFNSVDAVKWGVAQGVADTKEELAKQLGCAEWVEVGEKADEYQQEFRENVERAQVKIDELWKKLNMAVSFAQSAPNKKERDRNVGEARNYLRQMKGWVNRAPSLEFYMGLDRKFFREMDRQLREISSKSE